MARDAGERAGEAPGAEACWEKAVELLGRRPHFAAELAKKLRARGFAEADVGATLERAAAAGYLNDNERARTFAAELAERRGLGRAAIGRELARRGAAGEAVSAVVEGISAEDDLARAREAAERWRRRGGGDPAALARHLDRKGFARHVIFRVLREFAPDAEPLPESD